MPPTSYTFIEFKTESHIGKKMTNQLRVEFMGLTGFVPIKTDVEGHDAYLAVLPDLLYGADVNPAPGVYKRVPPHVPALIVPTDTIIHSRNKAPTMTFKTIGGPFAGRNYSLFPFASERMKITGLDDKGLKFTKSAVDVRNSNTHLPADSDALRGLQWIPDISMANLKAGRDAGPFNHDKFLNPDHTPATTRGSSRLAATLLVDSGDLYVDDVRREKGKPAMFEFKVPGERDAEWYQAVYSRLLWDGSFSGKRLTLNFQKGDQAQKAGLLELKPTAGWCEMYVANLELEALLGIGKPEMKIDMNADIDGSIFYKFCKNVPTPEQGWPVAHAQSGWVAGGSGLCIPMIFNS